MTNPLQALEKALKEINPNCDAWYSHDTYISWADLMKAIRICLDTDDDPTTDSDIEVAKSIAYAEGRDAGYDEGRDYGYAEGGVTPPGYLAAVLRFAGGGEASAVHEAAFPDGDDEPKPEPEPITEPEPMPITVPEPIAGLLRGIGERLDAGQEVVFLSSGESFAAGAKAQREADHRLLVDRGKNSTAWLLDSRPLVTDDDTIVTSGTEAVKRVGYAEGWDAGYAEGHAAGYRAALRFSGGGEA